MSSFKIPVFEKETGQCVTMLKETYLEIRDMVKLTVNLWVIVLICT